jgi:hypothetical protein
MLNVLRNYVTNGLACILLPAVMACAAEPAAITRNGDTWTLHNHAMAATVSFSTGKVSLTSLYNSEANTDYLKGQAAAPLFSWVIDGKTVTADDGGWALTDATTGPIDFYGTNWGQRLEVTLSRTTPVPFSTRQVFEIYNGPAGIRCFSYLKNGTDKPLAIGASDILSLNLPDRPHQLHYVTGNLKWNVGVGGVHRVGRNAIAVYDTGDGWYVLPENNWATSLAPGGSKGNPAEKLLYIYAWDNESTVRVSTNPNAVQLTLFPHEEVEYFSTDLGVFKGDAMDGRMAVAEHLRSRFKYHDPAHILSTNDWQWGNGWGRRSDKNYRDVVVPKAQAAGFDRVLIDDGWYAPDDSTIPSGHWTDMGSLSQYINDHNLKTGYWFSLQGRFCSRGWGEGRDAADPANIDFKLRQMEDELIGKYHSSWDQVDAGLLWKTDAQTPYSHPGDSVYRKILGMKRYMNTIAHKYPDFIMQTTCEIDNPGGAATHGEGAQNVGLIQLPDNGIMGMFRRSEYADDVRDLFAAVGLFPLEGMLSTHGEDGVSASAWQDSPVWYYQFLLARHTMIYSWPGDWSAESVAHLRVFNDWRKNPRFEVVLNEVMRPVYNGPDIVKNEGPWCWMFTDEAKSKALVFAINHRELNENNAFAAKLRWLDTAKTYLVHEVTMTNDGRFAYVYRGQYAGRQLVNGGLAIDLDDRPEPCAAFWIQEKTSDGPQLLYADAAVTHYSEKPAGPMLLVGIEGTANGSADLFVLKPAANGVEKRNVKLDPSGRAIAQFDANTITDAAEPLAFESAATPGTATFVARDSTTSGKWRGKFGATAAWLAGQPLTRQHGYALRPQKATTYVWGKDDQTSRVLEPIDGKGSKVAACWTADNEFNLRLIPPRNSERCRLTVYVMDYDNVRYPARAMELSVRTRDGTILDRQSASKKETNGGIYFTWTVAGPVSIHARKTEGYNAAVSGVFVDDLPVVPNKAVNK